MDIQQQESLKLTFTAEQHRLARCTVEQFLKAAVLECIAKEDAVEILRRQDLGFVIQAAYEDLKAFASKDPASQRNLEFIARLALLTRQCCTTDWRIIFISCR